MGIVLGQGWPLAPELPPPDTVTERDPMTAALLNLKDLLETLIMREQAPIRVEAPPVDFSSLMSALETFSPPDAAAIGQAVAAAIRIPEPPPQDTSHLEALLEAMNKLDFRMKGTGGGGSLSPDITDRMSRQLGHVVIDTMPAVNVTTSPNSADFFGTALVGTWDNQIELHLDDSNWATYGSETHTGGAPVGTQSGGRVQFSSGTGINGHYRFISTDVVKYRPLHEVYGAMTAAFVTPPTGATDTCYMWLLGEPTVGNGVAVGYKGTNFGIAYWRNGVEVSFTNQLSWTDPCRGAVGSGYTLNGSPVTLDPTKGQIYQVQCGLLGYAGFTVKVLSPDHTWVTVFTYNGLNGSAEPVFTNFDLYQYVDILKNGSDATNIAVNSACWAGGTTSTKGRLSDPFSARSLVEETRSVIFAKTPSNTYVEVTANAAGRLQVTNDSVGTDGAAVPAGTAMVGGTDGTNVQALAVNSNGNLLSRDFFAGGEILADQTPVASVVTFTFSSPVQLIQVMTTTVEGRVDPFGGTPSATAGIRVLADTPTLIPVQTSSVKVYAASGVVNVVGFRY